MDVILGEVLGGYGIKGWVRVHSSTDPAAGIIGYSPWTLQRAGEARQVSVLAHKLHGKKIMVQLEGVTDRNQADSLAGFAISVASSRLPALEEGTYYWFQLEGLAVKNRQGDRLGIVDYLIETGANDVLVVKPDGQSVDDRERLIPYLMGRVVLEVQPDVEILVDWEQDY